jgi:hypothetical protein
MRIAETMALAMQNTAAANEVQKFKRQAEEAKTQQRQLQVRSGDVDIRVGA